MLKKITLSLALIGLIVFNSCETKFSLNGDYKRIPIVFGLLNQSDSTHLIKITRTFLGDGNNYDFAQEADSSYFTTVDAKVIELDNGVETGRTWQLHDTIITNKETGTFYGPDQKLYVFYANDLIGANEYKLEADLDEGKYKINATTELIQNFGFDGILATSPSPKIDMHYTQSKNEFTNMVISFKKAKYAALYHFKVILNWKETYNDGSSLNLSKPWNVGSKDIVVTVKVPGNEFLDFIKENIKPDPNVAKREFLGLEIVATVASQDLVQYMEVSKPTSSLSTSTPKYTNINSDDQALGLFTARQILKLVTATGNTIIPLNAKTVETLCTHPTTGGLKFCSTLPEHISALKPYVCN